jgi:SpoVK/Ycf46/Vps4 family AAA+-type ATPase
MKMATSLRTSADLAAMASRYLGETEANLNRSLELAEQAEVALLLDEAEALFGTRGEVKDSRDRYAGLETSTVLARLKRLLAATGAPSARRQR